MSKIDTGIQIEEELERLDAVIESVLDDLDHDGVAFPGRPTGDVPQWPSTDITEIRNEDLYNLHARFRAYGRYAAGKAAKARLARDAAKERLKLSEAYVRKRTKGVNKDARDDSVTLDGLVTRMREELLYWESLCRMHDIFEDMLRKDVDAISRQMTQREKELEQGGRERSLGNKKRPPRRWGGG